MAKAYFATTHLLICADSEAEACDVVSALLSENGTHAEPPALIDWSYTAGADDRYTGPSEREIPDDYSPDDYDLGVLLADNPLLPSLRSVLIEVAALNLDPMHPLAVMAANARAEIGRTCKPPSPPCSEAAPESPLHFGLPGWTDADDDAACKESWAIFECSGSSGGEFQLQRLDDEAVFDDDSDVWNHVWTRMVLDDPLHTRALDFLMVNNPMEYFAINAFMTPAKG